MGGTEWTKQQKYAIDTQGKTLIVSAAAGSGKTAVLVERIIKEISGAHGKAGDVRRLMVVTFTGAAAAEMRAKISSAICAELENDPNNKALRRQLALIPSAHIETVDAFCRSLVKENFNLLGIKPDFAIAEQPQLEMLKAQALDEVTEEFYAAGDADFAEACEALTDGKDDKKMCAAVMKIYERIRSYPMPERYIKSMKNSYRIEPDGRIADSLWGKYLTERAERMIESGIRAVKKAAELADGFPELQKAYMPALEQDIKDADKLYSLVRGGEWQKTYDFCRGYTPAKLTAVRKFDDKELLERIKSMRNIWKQIFGNIKEKIFSCSERQAREDIERTGRIAGAVLDVVSALDRRFSELKRKKNIVDFGDVEHMAINLLVNVNEDGTLEKTELARRVSAGFDSIMVDEYQDTNATQDMIFRALSDDMKNLFMVGDVKQSIYGFRQANPEIFIEKYTGYEDIESAADGCPASISMNRNFRSRRQVIDAVNFIFKNTMSAEFGGLDYTEKEMLNPGAQYPNEDSDEYNSELYIIEKKANDGENEDSEDADAEDNAAEDGSATEIEAKFAAQKIKSMIERGFKVTDRSSGGLRPAEAGDFAILLRTASGKAEIYKSALEGLGIPCAAEQSGGFFESEEIMTVMSLLLVTDGFCREQALVGAMRGAAYNFSAEQLAQIRRDFPQVPFYQAVINSAHADPCGKCAEFVRDVEKYRSCAADLPVSQLVWKIYNEKELPAVFSAHKGGERRAENLAAFYEYSKKFDGANGGLSRFVSALLRMSQSGGKIDSVPQNGGGVRIMSIHKSKGLEFPIVIVPECAKRFNNDDIKSSVLFHGKAGLGIRLREHINFERTTIIRNCVEDRIKSDNMSEELRILYVALTRAKEKLIMTMTVASAEKSAGQWANFTADGMADAYTLGSQSTPAMWIAAPFVRHKSGAELRELAGMGQAARIDADFPMTIEVISAAEASGNYESSADRAEPPREQADERQSMTEDIDGEAREAARRLGYKYEYQTETAALSKVTPTMTKGRFFDGEAAEDTKTALIPRLKKPIFGKSGLSAAERGTAHHIAMQFMDFDKCADKNGIESEIKRLADRRILSAEQINALDIEKIAGFFDSDIARQMKKSKNTVREFKFSVLCPAGRFYAGIKSDDKVLLQGVVDCFFEADDGIVVIDFKSDGVRPGQERAAAQKYAGQLGAYAYALEQITGKKVIKSVLYFFATGATVEIGITEGVDR